MTAGLGVPQSRFFADGTKAHLHAPALGVVPDWGVEVPPVLVLEPELPPP